MRASRLPRFSLWAESVHVGEADYFACQLYKKHVLEENKVNTAQKLSESLHKTEPTPDGVDATGYVWHQNTKI